MEEHDCQNQPLSSAMDLSDIHPFWELSGTLGVRSISSLQKQQQEQQHQPQQSTRITSQPAHTSQGIPPTLHSISVADAARSLPQLVPPLYNYPPSISKLLLNCIIVAALWDLSFTHDCIYNAHSDIHSRMWHRAGRHFEISKCPARITNPILLN